MKRLAYLGLVFIVLVMGLPCCLQGRAPSVRDAPGSAAPPLAPGSAHPGLAREIAAALKKNHYRRMPLDDALSSKIFDRYLAELDSERTVFFASDITEFEKYRFTLDDSLRRGDLEPAFNIFNRYRQRMLNRLSSLLTQVGSGLEHIDFTIDETLETDRKDSPWPGDAVAMDDLWRRQLKSSALNLRLAGKEPEEIAPLLERRYRNQLNRYGQFTEEDVFQIFINALAMSYDPHTQYFSPRAEENFSIHMSLSLEGIGAVLQAENEHTKIMRLVPAGPADKTRELKAGDRIVGVGQGDEEIVDVIGWRLDDVVERIRGPKGSVVRLEIIPAEALDQHQTRIVSVVRDKVKLEEQAARKNVLRLEHGGKPYAIGVIEIPSFYLDFKGLQEGAEDFKSTTRDVERLLRELAPEKIDALIIDLRNNGGGSLQEVNVLTGLFIEQGPIVQVREARGTVEVLSDPDPNAYYRGPLAVMVNRLSASASEIFAGAIQDYRRGIVVGEQTYGKGTVQSLVPLSLGQLKVTLAMFYRVSGKSIQHKGVIPDIVFPGFYDSLTIGESSLPEALPWDTIAAAEYAPLPDLRPMIARLAERHQARTSTSPDYAYMLDLIAFINRARAKTALSLHEDTRRRERDAANRERLALENRRRKARGLDILKTLEDSLEDRSETPEAPSADEEDFMLTETGHILADFIELLQ
jgi:carboxyl-terminal processing protease